MGKQSNSTRDQIAGFGAAVRSRRDAAGLSQVELGERAGTHPTTVSLIEKGRRAPSLRLAADLASALGVTVDVLLIDAARLATPASPPARKTGKGK